MYPDECVHVVPNGAHVTEDAKGRVRVEHESLRGGHMRIPSCKRNAKSKSARLGFPADYNGWLAYTSYKTTADTFTNFLGNFSVPNAPRNTPQQLFIFTGLQNVDWIPKVDPMPSQPFDILQPVLQYPADDR